MAVLERRLAHLDKPQDGVVVDLFTRAPKNAEREFFSAPKWAIEQGRENILRAGRNVERIVYQGRDGRTTRDPFAVEPLSPHIPDKGPEIGKPNI